MPISLIEAKRRALAFLGEELRYDAAAVRVLLVKRAPEGWRVQVEITEPDEYLRKLGYPPVFNRNQYHVEVDPEGEVAGFGEGSGETDA